MTVASRCRCRPSDKNERLKLARIPTAAARPVPTAPGSPAACSAHPASIPARSATCPTRINLAAEVEYGLQPRGYGATLEIDHIVSLELGGSNSVANLYPERAPGFHVKDKLENRLHQMVCSGTITLRAAQQGIATNWQILYAHVYGTRPGVA